jgi:translocation and assembly module TamB
LSEADDIAPRRRLRMVSAIPKAIVAVCLVVLLVIAAGLAATRYGVLLPQVRALIEAQTDGLKISRYGRLKIEGLSGDIWRDLSIRKLTLRDADGVWLEADNLHMTWRYAELLRRRFHAQAIQVQTLRVLRRPKLTEKGPDTGNPLSVHIDQAHARVEMLPAFSYERGVYDLDLKLDVERSGGLGGKVRAASVLHPGDHLNLDFDLAKKHPLLVLADAVEARGGALAGALGLPSNQAFALKANASGQMSAGRFIVVAFSGATQPLKAQGAWTKDGGVASGRLSLTASKLTAPYASRFGPSAVFALAGRKSGPELFALEGRVRSENLKLTASGLGDLGKRQLGPQGVAVTAETGALSRITGGPSMGAAKMTGQITQPKGGWRFAGNATVNKADLAGYTLAQVSGPVEVIHRAAEWSVKTQIAGVGGRGTGFVTAALGASPKATFDGARLADGRLLLRQLQVTGQGLKVAASGGRSLLGGLTFKGTAAVSNLAAARVGAAGAATATWSAAQAKAAQPWTFTVDARGERLATGFPELDHLLGPKPQLRAQANLQGRRLAVGQASLNGAALQASTAGVLAEDGGLMFKLDWSADGPFHAGPVEISGKAKGSGAITGSISAPRADLIADLQAIDVPRLPLKDVHLTLSFLKKPDGSSGMIALTAASGYGPARARSDFSFPEGGVDLTALSVDAGGVKADGAVSLRSRTPSTTDLDVSVGHGAFLDGGRIAGRVRIADAAGGPQATLNLTAENARLPGATITIHSAKVTADGPLAHLPYTGQAEGSSTGGRWNLNGRGAVSETNPGYAVTFDGGGGLDGREAHTLETATIRFGGAERSARVRLASSDGGELDLDGRLSESDAEVKAKVAGLGLKLLNPDLTGKMDATLAVQGHGDQLNGTMEAKVSGARGRGAPRASAVDSTISGRLTDASLALDMTATNSQGLQATANVVLPTETSAAPFRVAIARQRPLKGRFDAAGEIRPLWDLLIGGERSLSGTVKADGTLGGTLADPSGTGEVAVDNGRFDDGATGLSLRNVALRAAFADNAVTVSQATGDDGHGGSLNGSGRMSLAREGVSSFRLDLKDFRLIDNDMATAAASGQATFDRAADGKVRLSGALTIDRADVSTRLPTPSGVVAMDVVEKNRPPELAAVVAPAQTQGDGWALDVTLKAPRGIFLKGRGLDVELSLDAHVGGTTARPDLSGTAHVVRGDYDFAGKRFEFDTQSVVYLSTRPEAIRLQLTATRDDPSLTASVQIRGTAAKPQITLTSTPTLPNDEVLSQVLFGTSASQLSPLEAAQLASALSSLAGGGGFDVIGNLRTFAGLDRLALGGGDASGVTVSGGKYLTDNVYLEITGGGREGPSAQVEWRVRRSLSILSRIGGEGDGRLAIRWRRDY